MRSLPIFDKVMLSIVALGTALIIGFAFGMAVQPSHPGTETVYIVNHAQGDISNVTIQQDIPAWQQAANQDFAPVWGTNQVKLELVKSVPAGGIEALFVHNGPVQGALAYHTVANGVPEIVVYAGVGKFYGYSNSVSFTHELFEMLADPNVSAINQGFPYPYVTVTSPSGYQQAMFPVGSSWIQEVSDPVEAYSFHLGHALISDFVTPNWWNDEVKGGYDFMGVLGSPYTIAKGGYASYEVGGQWFQVTNFRHAGTDARGFLRGEQAERR